MGFEFVTEVDSADRQTDALNQTPVPDQGNFRAAAAKVKQDRIFDIDSVDGSQIAEKRFGFSADRLEGQARFPGGHIQKLGTIAGVADRGGRHGQDGVGFHDIAHLGKIPQSGQGPIDRRRRENLVPPHAFPQPQALFLVVDKVVGSVGVNVQNDQPGRVGPEIDDGDSFGHGCILPRLMKSGGKLSLNNNSA